VAQNKFDCEKCYYKPIYNDDCEDVATELIRLAILHDTDIDKSKN
jgi:hypothetical protein